ncbi:transposase [Oceanobacillus alkalisoli]|uniref:transposase n=1 Tax=Oceanobacillus alkalisoli TaxID=2925113 RepID=UPI001F122762|nr:transposase [Oceanobacillus alkalisoli]MCF3942570.1 transposase [Oceanobacillus alkalisoli]
MEKQKSYDKEFKIYAVKLIEEKGRKVSETARGCGVRSNVIKAMGSASRPVTV